MQATELYGLGCKAYNGDRDARRAWLAAVTRLAMPIAVRYEVLPGLFAAKAALESGYGSDQYEVDFYEPQFGVRMQRKAQRHNNLVAMNAFPENQLFLSAFPAPKWEDYRAFFRDYGPHYRGNRIELTPREPWMHFESVEDCCEAWCANMRYQAALNHKAWGSTIREQLLAIESYTPEGAEAETPGMHFEWQDLILYLYQDYDLYAYDREAYGMSVKMTTANLDEHIKKAYAYAHEHCKYGPTDRSFPPMEDGIADCVGLVLRALYTMGYNSAAHNIDEIHALCKAAGLVRSDNISDAFNHHGVVCMQDKNNAGTQHVNHAYYSLGGSSVHCISKYDLGSNARIQADQPYASKPVNEWTNSRVFLCCYYIPDEKLEDVPAFEPFGGSAATVTKNTGLYAGPGTAWRKKGTLKAGTAVTAHQLVTNGKNNLFRFVKTCDGATGYVFSSAVKLEAFTAYNGMVKGTDGSLSLRVGAGGGCYKICDIPEGEMLRVDGSAMAGDGTDWLHVKWNGKRGFVAAKYIRK